MADALHQPVVLDATVLSNFASSQAVDWLVELVDQPAIVPAVRIELQRGHRHGHEFLADAITTVEGRIPLLRERDGPVPFDVTEVDERLDAGEAESLVRAAERDGTLATDDLAARRFATDNDVRVTGSVGLLVVGIEREALDVATADEWLATWRAERGYYAPVDSVAEIVENRDG